MDTRALFDLSGRTAIVTGGGRGIGRHISIGLAEAGARVVAVSRKLEACEEVVREIESKGHEGLALAADVSKPEDVDRVVAEVIQRYGAIDVLVNNAGMAWAAPTLEYPLEGWDRVFDLNVRGLFYFSQQVAKHMAKRGRGSIIQVSSISAFRTSGDDREPVVAYNASKGAVVSLTRDLAVKLAPLGIRVNGIAPGPFLTSMMDHVRHDADALEKFNTQIPLRRSADEDDMKGVAVFLASDASGFVTGHTLVVDGGMLCGSPAI